MSWDVLIMRFPEDFKGFNDLPDKWEPEELFTHNFFATEIKILFPKINDADKNWITLKEETFSIEFNTGDDDDPISHIMLHVRGGDEALKVIELLCKKFNVQAFDTTEGEIINFENKPTKGFTQWRKYKDTVLKKKK
ncbi:MAG: hypothetical protein LBQ84_09150 [Flavobacteriaceae bacterium]|jgi:hypothetical protein|nr:hypothetical protein [Flavobacteriaceae bacterium]